MTSSPDWNSKQAQLLSEIENFAIGTPHDDATLTPSELRALARAPLDIDLSEPIAPRATVAPRPGVAVPAPGPAAAPPTPPAAAPASAAPVAPVASAAAPAAPAGGLLAQLKRQAEEKLAAQSQSVAVEAARLRQIDSGLRAAYRYLNDLVQQLNVIKPQYPADYPLGTILRIEKPGWQESQADFRRKLGPTDDLPYLSVSLRYVLRGGGPMVLDKADHLVDTTRKALHDFGLGFTLEEKRNGKGFVERGRFVVQPEIKAGLMFEADYEKGTLQLRTRNVQRFGSSTYNVPPESLTEQTLEEIALLVLGQSNQFIQRFQRVG